MMYAICIMSGVLGLGAVVLLAVSFLGMSLEFAEGFGGVEDDCEEEEA